MAHVVEEKILNLVIHVAEPPDTWNILENGIPSPANKQREKVKILKIYVWQY